MPVQCLWGPAQQHGNPPPKKTQKTLGAAPAIEWCTGIAERLSAAGRASISRLKMAAPDDAQGRAIWSLTDFMRVDLEAKALGWATAGGPPPPTSAAEAVALLERLASPGAGPEDVRQLCALLRALQTATGAADTERSRLLLLLAATAFAREQ